MDRLDDLLEIVPFYQAYFLENPTVQLSRAAMTLDQAYSLEAGESLQKLRTLLAMRVFLFDIRQPWSEITLGGLCASADILSLRDRYVANQ